MSFAGSKEIIKLLTLKIKDAARRPSELVHLREASRGFEPLMRVLQTLALPLGHDAIVKLLSGRWDSNPRPSPWQGDVLPLYYARISWSMLLTESAETQDRTGDTAIFSRVLYQLSYLGQTFCC